MKIKILIFFLSLSFGLIAQTPAADPVWQLVFSEDFNMLDPALWKAKDYEDNFGETHNLCVNDAQHVQIQSGNLVLSAQRFSVPQSCPDYGQPYKCQFPSYNYECGWVNSQNQNFTYGYYEIRAKMDYVTNFWPALWLLNSATKVHYSEIDILEVVGNQQSLAPGGPLNTNNYYTTNLHGPDPSNPNNIDPNGTRYYADVPVNDYTQYHTYGLEWSPNQIKWYLDGYVVGSIVPSPGQFDQYMVVIFDTKFKESLTPTSIPLTHLYIDYFRYYQLKGNCTPAITACNYNFSTYINEVKQSYSIGGGGCSSVVPSGYNYSFRAKAYVELNDGFEVPVGSEFYANADQYCDLPTYSTGVCEFVMDACSYDFSGYINTVKKRISIGGSGCNTTVQTTDNVSLLATDYIDLLEGFYVPSGSQINVNIQSCPP